MTLEDYLRLADDGCPNCEQHVHLRRHDFVTDLLEIPLVYNDLFPSDSMKVRLKLFWEVLEI